jgi:mono/diheme cytochrome c family protein
VDADAIPPDVAAAIKSGKVDLESPATTVTLLKLNAVVGLQGAVETADGKDRLVRLGITCALCHSTVDGKSTPLVLPPAYGLAKVKNETYTAEGPISYWNAYVAVTQMHGHGNFSDPRLGIDIRNSPDMVGPKLAALRSYQHSLETPRPPSGNADVAGAERGRAIFKDNCAGCHIGGTGTDNNSGTLHAPSETGMDAKYAARTANKKYRTTPLRALWEHPPYFHDGSAQTLPDVVEHYSRVRKLRLSDAHKRDLVEYLETL